MNQEKPNILKILNIGVITGLAVALASFALPLIPCKKAAVIAEPEYSWGLCKLANPFKEPLLGISQKFYNLSSEPLAGFLLQLAIPAILVAIFFIFLRKKPGKIVDLTKK